MIFRTSDRLPCWYIHENSEPAREIIVVRSIIKIKHTFIHTRITNKLVMCHYIEELPSLIAHTGFSSSSGSRWQYLIYFHHVHIHLLILLIINFDTKARPSVCHQTAVQLDRIKKIVLNVSIKLVEELWWYNSIISTSLLYSRNVYKSNRSWRVLFRY